jgi:D-sedoheptulose 7-phosphate isomerase
MNEYWRKYENSMAAALQNVRVTLANGEQVTAEHGLQLACDWTKTVRDTEGTMHFVGNGASACMASHMAIDWTKNAGVRALVYNDTASLTAIGNDFGYDKIFSGPIRWHGRKGDLLATISSSGNSPNVLQAIDAAREKGMRVVTFSGMKPDNNSSKRGDLNFYVPAWTYGIAECSHQILLHAWLDRYMNVCEWEMPRT